MKIMIEIPTWLGDSVMATPAIENLIKHYESSEITLIGSKLSLEVLKNHPKVVNSHIIDKKIINLYKLIKGFDEFDVFISFRSSLRSKLIKFFISATKKFQFDKIAAIVSRGFVFASAVSYILNKPFIMLRKKNKLPADVHSVDFELEYGTATIEVHKDSINENDSVLIIDDLIATGGTAEAAAKLVEISKAKVAAFIFVINLFDLNGTDNLVKKGYKVENLIEFPGH